MTGPNVLPATQPVTIFIVDDDDVDVLGIERALHKLKIINPVVRAKNGVEALAMLRDKAAMQRPYLILLDINMPIMGGIKMLMALRQDPELSDSVVFMLTTSNDDKDKIEAYKLHVAGYIVKNQANETFLGVIQMLDHYWRVVELPV
jgi:CheY-like chemotaxis protein